MEVCRGTERRLGSVARAVTRVCIAFAFALGGVGFAGHAAPAQAGTVYLFEGVLVFWAAPGERNNLEITQADGSFTVVDSSPLTVEVPCVSTDPFTAVCAVDAATPVSVALGDLDDSAEIVVDYNLHVGGQDGADTITVVSRRGVASVRGGRDGDTLAEEGRLGGDMWGGGGKDTLTTRARGGFLSGGGGDDLVDARLGKWIRAVGGPGDDRLVGGPQPDFLDADGGRDMLSGKGSADRLLGGWGNDVLIGGRGRDQLWGERGDDLIVGGSHFDRVRGGRDDDTLRMRDGEPDRVRGDGGSDRARVDRRLDRVFGVEALF